MKKAVKSAMNESEREYNVIMFNVEEQKDDDTSENYNYDTALNQWRNVVHRRPPAGSRAPIWHPLFQKCNIVQRILYISKCGQIVEIPVKI